MRKDLIHRLARPSINQDTSPKSIWTINSLEKNYRHQTTHFSKLATLALGTKTPPLTNMSSSIPRDFHNLRACLVCNLIKQADQFEKSGCENCEEVLGLRHNKDMVSSCTTSNFSGMIALCQPDDSWVARWQRINKRVQGMYAIDVFGKLPPNIAQEIRAPYRER